MKTKHTTALTITTLTALLLTSCGPKDEKAGYPQTPPAKKTATQTPAPPPKKKEKTAYKPAVKPAPGPAGALAAQFCALSTAANYNALAKLFSPQFMIRAAIPQNNTSEITDKQINEMSAETTKTIATDIKTSRLKPVEDCEIINTQTLNCETAVTAATNRYPEKTTQTALKTALKNTNTTQCGFIAIREISNTGIEETHFFIGNPGGKWKILTKVTQ